MPQSGPKRRTSLVFPILLIAIGALFLFRNWHPDFHPYQVLRVYWPLILVLVGLGKIYDWSRQRNVAGGDPNAAPSGASSPGIAVGSTLGIVAFVAVLVILLAHYQKSREHFETSDGRDHFASQNEEVLELQGATSVEARLRMGAGEANISGGSSHLLNSQFHFDRDWDSPRVDYHVSDGKGYLDISQEKGNINFGANDNRWDLKFNNDVPINLRMDMGAGQGNLNLRDTNVRRLELHIGAGEVMLDLTGDRKSDLDASISGGVGQATIRLPRDVGVIAHAKGGIGSIDTGELEERNGGYVNKAYGKSAHTIRLDVQGGIGEIELVEE